MSDKDFNNVRRAIETAGAPVWSIHSTEMAPRPGEPASAILNHHKKIIERGAALGARCITHHPGQWHGLGKKISDPNFMKSLLDTLPKGYARMVHVEVLQAIKQEARNFGIEPTIETCPTYIYGGGLFWSPDRLISLADEAGVGICYDTGHWYYSGIEPIRALSAIDYRLKETHFSDSFGKISPDYRGCDVHTPCGIGVINWPAVICMLEKIGYKRPVVFEQNDSTGIELGVLEGGRISISNWRVFEKLATQYKPLRNHIEKSICNVD